MYLSFTCPWIVLLPLILLCNLQVCVVLFSETLINNNDAHDSDDGAIELAEQQNGSFNEVAPSTPAPSKTWAWFYIMSAAVMASLGGVLFGYDIG